MKRVLIQFFVVAMLLLACESTPGVTPEPWVAKPISEWPIIPLTNEVSFSDTVISNLGNSFLVTTGKDTIGVSCKHMFVIFENPPHLTSIDLGPNFDYWDLYPKNDPDHRLELKRLINANPDEPIGYYNTLKDRDWIIFELEKKDPTVYPLKIRYTPLETNEIIYSVGWSWDEENKKYPNMSKMQCYKIMGNYYYVKTLSDSGSPAGRSGSPVIDKNGYLVGIVSGAEGNLGIIGSVQYLRKLFDDFGVDYVTVY
jgi:hypothetical protein